MVVPTKEPKLIMNKNNINMIMSILVVLLMMTTTVVTANNAVDPHTLGLRFPPDFMFGTATAAYQIEGAVKVDGRLPTIWDLWSHTPGKIADNSTGDNADESYYRYAEDIQILANMSAKYYRFSLAWSRLMNADGSPNAAGIQHYHAVLDECDKHMIQPVVTLYHWDTPVVWSEMQTNPAYNGWLSETIVARFVEYARIAFDNFGARVKFWTTLNEPKTVALSGYDQGNFAPGRCSDRSACVAGNSSSEPYLATHNQLLAHAEVGYLYKTRYAHDQGGVIGITLNADWAEPFTDSAADKAAAQRNLEFQFSWFADPIFSGKYPDSMVQAVGARLPTFTADQAMKLKNSIDFIGLNHYTTRYVKASTTTPGLLGGDWNSDQQAIVTQFAANGTVIGLKADSDWLYVVPWGFRPLLNWIKNRYNNPLIIVTENGVDVPNESAMKLPDVLHDDFRIDYYAGYLSGLADAIQYDKVNVRGYFAWSLLDNFEWADGYSKRFGLHYVDYTNNATRYTKDSAVYYQQVMSSHSSQAHVLF